ncbi:DbpA RNA binding domain-containing protein, partial [Pseudoalteromonas sp. SIMBA_162]
VQSLVEEGHDPVELAAVFVKMARAEETPIQSLPKPGARRNERSERGERTERPERGERRNSAPVAREGMKLYRVAVGHRDGVKPGQLVGALANEGGIEGSRIGRIDIRNTHSVVELP